MWSIASTDELSFFEYQQRPIGMLIAQQFDRTVLEWIFDSWDELHHLSGYNWHIVVPCRPARNGERPTRANFDVLLSNRLREMYGIGRNDTPVLVLDNFSEDERQLYLKISSDERERKAMFTRMAKFIDRRMSDMDHEDRPGANWRRTLIDDLYDNMKLYELGAAAFKLAPRAASAAARLLRGGSTNS